MINRSHVWFSAFVVILFAAGVGSGVALDRAMRWGQHWPGPGFRGDMAGANANAKGSGGGRGMGGPGGRGGDPGGPPTEMFVNELDQTLALTADQKTKITAIIEASRPRLRTLQEDVSKKFSDEQQAVTDEIAKLLTPDQSKKLDTFQKEHRGGPFGFRGGRGRR